MLDKTYAPASVEARIYADWEKQGAFAAGSGAKPGADSFCIVIPPPNVTGSLHMGHALNNTLQDILIRWKRMLGLNVLWQPGTDHAGIATQMVVERELAANGEPSRRDMGRDAFVDRVWQQKSSSENTILGQLKRLGCSCDWSRTRFTMDDGLSAAVLKVFVELYREGLIYRGKRLVNWDPKFETAISDLEVENLEVDGHMWHFKYPLAGGETYEYIEKDEDGNETLRETRDYISIATTRPETMLGDGAVAVHPSDERYSSIVGKLCEIPVGPKDQRRLIPIITDEYPDPEFGSGAVKITGAHDFNDYGVAKRNSIPCYRLMDTQAQMRADGEPYAEAAATAQKIIEGLQLGEAEIDAINLVPDEFRGLDRYEARNRVVEQITAEGLAVMVPETDPRLGPVKAPLAPEEGGEVRAEVPLVENKKIMQPFGDRSKVVIEPMLTDQWFVDAEKLAGPAIEAVRDGRTKFVPENWDKTYYNWMENIEPWCISRQLWWGHQIPAWYGPDDTVFVAADEAEALDQAIQHYLAEEGPWKAWVEERIDNIEPGDILQRDPDVLDTWFSSALWPFSTLGWPDKTDELERYYKTDVLVTGFDIIFFWVARMMMQGLHFLDEVPFHTVYINSIVVDKNGKKMSKSLGNVLDPLELIDEFGADATRYALASQEVQARRTLRMSDQAAAGGQRFGTKLWNAARFTEMNGCERVDGFDPQATTVALNRWIIGELDAAVASVTAALEAYRFNDAANAIYRFIWNTYCDWFLELAKPVLMGEDGAAKDETRATTAHVRDEMLKLLHPIMPFITEELWQSADGAKPGDTALIQAEWPVATGRVDEGAKSEIDWVIDLISTVRSVRTELNVPAGAKVPLVFVAANDTTRERFTRNEESILRLARLESVGFADAAPEGSVQLVVGEATVALVLKELVDVAAETARLTKERGKLEKEAGGLEKKLSNEGFLAKAPEEVVDEQRERLAEAQGRLAKVDEAIGRLKSLG
ncbi:valine--tRNA ligase [Tepidamorphus sp. 3E244]|uniref:valine--tRNA ligase n=1 Tax=Tepidamorphus sp. 3E244 TaxID=3385498 RepID=UPI0038FCC2C1